MLLRNFGGGAGFSTVGEGQAEGFVEIEEFFFFFWGSFEIEELIWVFLETLFLAERDGARIGLDGYSLSAVSGRRLISKIPNNPIQVPISIYILQI